MSDENGDGRLGLFYRQPSASQNEQMETAKLFDGFFLGNSHACREAQFLLNNKIGLIINCVPLELITTTEPGIITLPYNFHNKRGNIQQRLSSPQITELATSIEEYLHQRLEGVLVVSKSIDSRAICIAAAYFMAKFGWEMEEAVGFIRSKKQDIQLAQTYAELLQDFEKCSHRSGLSQTFNGKDTREHQGLLKNTVVNSERKVFPNFNGLCYLKEERLAPNMQNKGRGLTFAESVEQINGSSSTNVWAKTEAYLRSPRPREGQAAKTAGVVVVVNVGAEGARKGMKLWDVEEKLRNYIKQRCHSSNSQSFGNQRQNQEAGRREQNLEEKAKEATAPHKRAASKTEEPTDQPQNFRVRIKRNNYMDSPFRVLNQSAEGSVSKRLIFEEDPTSGKLKSFSTGTSKANIPRRCYTQATNHSESTVLDQSKINNLFKISKSNKTSHKKIRPQLPYHGKAHTLKSPDKNVKQFNSELSASFHKLGLEEAIAQHLSKRRQGQQLRQGEQLKQNIINFNVNVQIGSLNVLSRGPEPQEGERKHSSKVKSRVVPKRAGQQGGGSSKER